MARIFNGTTDIVNCGSPSALDNIVPFTYAAWIKPNSAGETNYGSIFRKETSGLRKALYVTVNGTLGIYIDRATTDCQRESATSTLAFDGTWQFVAVTYDESAGAKLYKASLTSALAEVSYGTTNNNGAGSTISDIGHALGIGNNAATDRTFNGALAHCSIYSVVLTLAEMNMIRYGLMPRRSSLKGWWPLYGTSSPEVDLSGGGSNGTVTGTTVGDHPPVASPFGFDMGWMGNYTSQINIPQGIYLGDLKLGHNILGNRGLSK